MAAERKFTAPSEQRTTVLVWITLTLVTVIAWLLAPGHSHATTDPNKLTAAAVALLGLLKCRLITSHFMEVRHAPRRLRVAIDTWLTTLWAALVIIYLY